MPIAIYLLGVEIFCLTTSEYMVSGLQPGLSAAFGVSIAAVGFLVTAYAGAMSVGGPILTVGLLRWGRKRALMTLALGFVLGQVAGALAPNYGVLLGARIFTGIAAASFFGVALTLCAHLVPPEQFGRASSTVLGGLMLGTVLGLPLETFIGNHFGWRTSFWTVAGLALLTLILLLRFLPALPADPSASVRAEFAAFSRPALWAVYTTSLLLVGSTFAAFTYFVPILRGPSGFSSGTVPVLLVLYGLATIIGNAIVGRLADRWTIPVLATGLLVLTLATGLFALSAGNQAAAVTALIAIGLAGVSMNPALVTRGARVGGNSLMVNVVHTAFIMLGVMLGSFLGGLVIDADWGVRAALWVGAALGLAGLVSLAPELRSRSTPTPASPSARTDVRA